tara:strand:- start:2819 stop:3490 length:672 start_codon:yes stop_codon:yes gene_type:complete
MQLRNGTVINPEKAKKIRLNNNNIKAGFLVFEDCFDEDAIVDMKRMCDRLVKNKNMNCGGNRHVTDMSFEPCFYDYMKHLEHTLQDAFSIFRNCILNHSLEGGLQLITALPYAKTNQNWHRDTEADCGFSYAVMIPLVDMTTDNGPFQIIPQSTKMCSKDCDSLSSVTVTTKKGDVVIFDARLLHRGSKNMTCTERPVLVTQMEKKEYKHGWTTYDPLNDESL